MCNVLDVEPARAAARRISGKIPSPEVAARFEKLSFERLLGDKRNHRPASPTEIANGPPWAREAASRGEPVDVFKLDRGASMRLHNVARLLAKACALAAAPSPRPGSARFIVAAREFIAKIDRANFDTIADKARGFALIYESWCEVSEPLCKPGRVSATQDRLWTRITSLAELRGVGREMTNCLARTSETAAYGGHLKDGRAQFWVLRDRRGVALMVAMAPTRSPTEFREVKGPRNAPVSSQNPDLRCLRAAILLESDEPPPPPPPSAALAQLVFGMPGRGQPNLLTPLFALDSQEEIARLRFGVSEVVITRRRRRAS